MPSHMQNGGTYYAVTGAVRGGVRPTAAAFEVAVLAGDCCRCAPGEATLTRCSERSSRSLARPVDVGCREAPLLLLGILCVLRAPGVQVALACVGVVVRSAGR